MHAVMPPAGIRRHASSLWLAVAVGVLALAGAGSAGAQVLPAGCTSDGTNPAEAQAGDTVTCLAPNVTGPIEGAVEDLSIVVGGAANPVTVSGGCVGVSLSGTVGPQGRSLSILNPASSVSGSQRGLDVNSTESAAGGDLVIVSEGAISGDTTGVYLRDRDTAGGAVSLSVTDVTGTTGSGIDAMNWWGGGDMSISATGTVTAGDAGIAASHLGDGAMSLSARDVSSQGDAIDVYASTEGTTLTLETTGTVDSAAAGGMDISHQADAAATITATGPVSGGTDGIFVSKTGHGGLALTAADVTGDGKGVYAFTGQFSTTQDVNITGTLEGGDIGLHAVHWGEQDATITTGGPVSGGTTGLLAENDGQGAMAISTDVVQGATGDAISVYTGTSSTTLTLETTGTVDSAAASGMNIWHQGGAAATITATGPVSGGTNGIFVYKPYEGGLALSAADVTGGEKGVYALTNQSSTTLDVNITGTLEGGDIGLDAVHWGEQDATITTGCPVSGGTTGLLAENDGQGAMAISTDAVQGATGFGISAEGGADTTALSINSTGAIAGAQAGISAAHAGSGDVTVTASAPVTGSDYGIQVNNTGTGGLSISAAAVTGTAEHGIEARSDFGSSTFNLATTDAVSGGNYGILVDHRGSGDAVINAAGTVSGTDWGISANNSGSASNLSVTMQAAVTGGSFGVYASQNGLGGDLAVNATGPVSATGTGIQGLNFGGGSVAVSAAGVTSTAGRGIFAYARFGADADLSVHSAGPVSAHDDGLYAYFGGGGALDIQSADITAGANGIMIDAAPNAASRTVTVTGDVRGASGAGIRAPDGVTIANQGSISGGANGVLADADLVLTNAMGGDIGADAGAGVVTGAGARITNAGTIAGVDFSTGSERLTLTTTGILEGLVDFGANDDLLTFDGIMAELVGSSSTLADYTGLSMAEAVAVGLPLFYGGAGTDTIAFDAGVSVAGLVSRQWLGTWADEGVYGLTFRNGDSSPSTLVYAGFEVFTIDGQHLSESDLPALPLPGSLSLLLGGLGSLRLLLRRRS